MAGRLWEYRMSGIGNTSLLKIRSDQLRPGMYLHKLCGSWMQHPFWRTSFLIRDATQIATIIDSGITEVWIDADKGDVPVDAAASDAIAAPDAADGSGEPVGAEQPAAAGAAMRRTGPNPAPRAGTDSVPLHEELATARRICQSSKEVVTGLFNEARLGKALSTEVAASVVDEISGSVLRNPGALISIARLKNADDYTYLHSVAVCALMVALARQAGLPDEQTRQAGLGGLLHDMGKARIPLELLNKPSSLSESEFSIIRTHPQHGHDLLREGGVADVDVLDVVLHHHERHDGAGYPHGLAAEAISLLARMGAICDVYDAITSDRPYKAGWDPAQAIHRMHSWNGHFDPTLMQHFIRSVGIYPVGALVRLESDKLGVVCEPGRESLLKPIVRVFYSAKARKQIAMHDVDLAAPGCQDRITGVEAAATWGFRNLERLWIN